MTSDRLRDTPEPPPLATLLEPITIGTRRAVNRIAVAPMTNKQSHADGTLADEEVAWLTRRAAGGFGLIITGGWAVAPEGRVWDGQTALYADRHGPPLGNLTTSLARTRALGVVQLIHGGSRATPAITGTEGVSASAGAEWRAATSDDIAALIDAHVTAAVRVRDAGLDGVEVHAAHGYLPAQFLSRTGNTRTDTWGGDLAGRARFLLALIDAIRRRVGPDFLIGVRLSAEDPRHGIELDDTATVSGWVVDHGADYAHISLGDATAMSQAHPDRHPLAVIQDAVRHRVPVLAAGAVWTSEEALAVQRYGADIIALGQVAILNPDWPTFAADPQWDPRLPPVSADELPGLSVAPPFAEYLQEGWPDLVGSQMPAGPFGCASDRSACAAAPESTG